MKIDIITLLPDLLQGPFDASIVRRARDKGLVDLRIHDVRPYGMGRHRQVDDYAFGGEAGMVMRVEPLFALIRALQEQHTYDHVIYLTPDGVRLDQSISNRLSLKGSLLLICGHYKGIDQRVRDRFVDLEISIGDYVLSGGELAAAVLVDSVVRLLPGVLSDETSALTDSFQDGLLAPPVYTRPAVYEGMEVPEVLLSGDPAKIEAWRMEQALERTQRLRPDLLEPEA
ncbi:tRNA (guanosine(37)-N1)-methyltransferase TrmD [bacterium]|nr:tRNA (guanosine(37)-N1)-methyltransferase TrmD [bacterium]